MVEVLNKIQQVCGAENAPFEVTDIGYMAYINKENKLEGIITIQKRARETLEDDIAMGAMLAFHIGNNVQSVTAQSFKWCPVSGEYGQTQCGVTAITAAHVGGSVQTEGGYGHTTRWQTHMDHTRHQGRHDPHDHRPPQREDWRQDLSNSETGNHTLE